jgi:hypothetical protein
LREALRRLGGYDAEGGAGAAGRPTNMQAPEADRVIELAGVMHRRTLSGLVTEHKTRGWNFGDASEAVALGAAYRRAERGEDAH